jgi:hypothetical protein
MNEILVAIKKVRYWGTVGARKKQAISNIQFYGKKGEILGTVEARKKHSYL